MRSQWTQIGRIVSSRERKWKTRRISDQISLASCVHYCYIWLNWVEQKEQTTVFTPSVHIFFFLVILYWLLATCRLTNYASVFPCKLTSVGFPNFILKKGVHFCDLKMKNCWPLFMESCFFDHTHVKAKTIAVHCYWTHENKYILFWMHIDKNIHLWVGLHQRKKKLDIYLTCVCVRPREAANSARSGSARYWVRWNLLFSCWSCKDEYIVRGFRIFFPFPLSRKPPPPGSSFTSAIQIIF